MVLIQTSSNLPVSRILNVGHVQDPGDCQRTNTPFLRVASRISLGLSIWSIRDLMPGLYSSGTSHVLSGSSFLASNIRR
jgi:hypothetical protein